MTRSEQRQQILALVFEKSFQDVEIPELFELAREARQEEFSPFVEASVGGVFAHLPEIDAKIAQYAIGWKLERIPRVSLAIMRVAIYEMLFADDIDVGVAINEAVNLAKTYGGDDDPAYVNGVLGAVARGM